MVWTTRAKNDLREILSYVWVDNPAASRKLRSRIETSVKHLGAHPFSGRPGAIVGTREAVPHPSYRLVYQVTDDSVFILRIVHTSRQWPPVEDES
ncbi:type II toxin-antitoxin system RelE/ParE family toxin [Mesorhizobium sp. VNQ89]|uniref:type II toxin-antitoxin system RelE/ParE family toxin n=1 Tax=Mesorhizobium quangtriensis TaxID=3157709 RepID=UPI0032B87B6C